MTILQARGIGVSFGGKEVLKNIDIDVLRGDIVTIVGPNGSGKSTIMKVLSRTLKPKQGKVLLDNRDISGMNTVSIAKRLAVLPQVKMVPADFSVEMLVGYGRYPHLGFGNRMTKEDLDIVGWAIDRTGMAPFRYRLVRTLSGGERQRAWIAMALAQKSEILLLDEPTTFLDISYQLEILELLKELNNSLGLTIVMVLHDLNQAVRYSDKIYALKGGRLYKCSDSCELLTKELLKDVFRVEGDILADETNGCDYFIPQRVIP
jgi:iron complex transport system ATP-binding protein